MFWFETLGPQSMIEAIGADRVLLETDIPHPTCLYPSARDHFEKVLCRLDGASRQRIVRDNAINLYKLELA
jgi:predicted TIM-barrel fold metal-dependent hydrolase